MSQYWVVTLHYWSRLQSHWCSRVLPLLSRQILWLAGLALGGLLANQRCCSESRQVGTFFLVDTLPQNNQGSAMLCNARAKSLLCPASADGFNSSKPLATNSDHARLIAARRQRDFRISWVISGVSSFMLKAQVTGGGLGWNETCSRPNVTVPNGTRSLAPQPSPVAAAVKTNQALQLKLLNVFQGRNTRHLRNNNTKL